MQGNGTIRGEIVHGGDERACQLVLTGGSISAMNLERVGIVNKTCAEEQVLKEACNMAEGTERFSAPALVLAKQAVSAAESTTLQGGLELEKALELYYSSFSPSLATTRDFEYS
ncbi:hypothetical protein AC578_5664 [Pseudocercospora eumusae]|uniref:Uncharacterized protein n=1 Tax=Pseudocercospora eumusae TaxID=321146 RepID=A0A139HTI8_9PEZI|nr:hypothetical protein AC578_5664 [Pseudocercospora eumusae]